MTLPDYWPWLALAIAAWWLVGFAVARKLWPDESLRALIVDAWLAPFTVVWSAPFVLIYARGAWPVRKLRAEVERIGANDVRVDGREGRAELYDVRPGDVNFRWGGTAEEALSRLRSVPTSAGRDFLWNVFPERKSSPYHAVRAELERIGGGTRPPSIIFGFRGAGGTDPLDILDSWDEQDPPPRPDPEWTWVGTGEAALERLRGVQDGAGRDGLWDAFPDKTRKR